MNAAPMSSVTKLRFVMRLLPSHLRPAVGRLVFFFGVVHSFRCRAVMAPRLGLSFAPFS